MPAPRLSPSPNHDARPPGQVIDLLILHYTGMVEVTAALERLCDPAAAVSAHWLVEEDGTVWQLVPEERRAWHAGRAFWRGDRAINARSIGVEIHNPGHEWGYRSFPEAQMRALEALCEGILARHPIPPGGVLAHSDVAPARKEDPGELFDWRRLARRGIGLWLEPVPSAPRGDVAAAQALLARVGYEVEPSGAMDLPTRAALLAFQRHHRPWALTGAVDGETLARLEALALLTGG